LQHYIDETTQELYAYEVNIDPSFIKAGLIKCSPRPSEYHTFNKGKWSLTATDKTKQTNDLLSITRAERDILLQSTDKYLVGDFPITAAQLAKVKTWRQSLREVMNTSTPSASFAILKTTAPLPIVLI